MSPEADELLKKAMALPPEERGALAASLLESLEEGGELDLDAEADMPPWARGTRAYVRRGHDSAVRDE